MTWTLAKYVGDGIYGWTLAWYFPLDVGDIVFPPDMKPAGSAIDANMVFGDAENPGVLQPACEGGNLLYPSYMTMAQFLRSKAIDQRNKQPYADSESVITATIEDESVVDVPDGSAQSGEMTEGKTDSPEVKQIRLKGKME